MMIKFRLGFLFLLLTVLVFSTSPIFANGIKADLGASGKGVVNPAGGCAATIAENPDCVDFSTAGALPTWTAFETDNSGSTPVVNILGPYNLFLVNGISSITFQLTGNANFGTFFCGTQDGMSGLLGGNCTNVRDSGGSLVDPPFDLSGLITEDDSNLSALNQVTFTFVGGSPQTDNGNWVFYATAGDASILSSTTGGGTTSTREPGTLLLLAAGAGLLALAKLRRA